MPFNLNEYLLSTFVKLMPTPLKCWRGPPLIDEYFLLCVYSVWVFTVLVKCSSIMYC